MTELQSLTLRIRDFSDSADRWNTAMVWSLACAAIVAVAIGVTTSMALKRTKQLGSAQEEMAALKESEAKAAHQQLGTELATAVASAKDADARIAEAQRSTAEAKEATAKLEVEGLALRKELLSQGSRENLLHGDIRKKLISALIPFAGQSVEVRYGRSTFGIIQQTPDPAGPDVIGLADSLIKVLQEAHWSLAPVPMVSALGNPPGITVHVSTSASPATIAAADVLVNSLRAVPLEIQGPIKLPLVGTPRIGTVRMFTPDVPGGPATEKPLPEPTDETVVLVVLAHPK